MDFPEADILLAEKAFFLRENRSFNYAILNADPSRASGPYRSLATSFFSVIIEVTARNT